MKSSSVTDKLQELLELLSATKTQSVAGVLMLALQYHILSAPGPTEYTSLLAPWRENWIYPQHDNVQYYCACEAVADWQNIVLECFVIWISVLTVTVELPFVLDIRRIHRNPPPWRWALRQSSPEWTKKNTRAFTGQDTGDGRTRRRAQGMGEHRRDHRGGDNAE